MKILVGSWFELPKLGRDVFLLLMKQGVKYEKEMGFKFDADTDLAAAVRVLSSALGEDVELALRCFVCGLESCTGCPYLEVCDRRNVSSFCLCGTHARGDRGYEVYAGTFRELLNA